jgi:hypothetical protein
MPARLVWRFRWTRTLVACQNSCRAPDLGFYPRRSCSFASSSLRGGRILVQRPVWPMRSVVTGVLAEDQPQMTFAGDLRGSMTASCAPDWPSSPIPAPHPRRAPGRRGETIPWHVIAAQIAPRERRGSR